MLSDTHRSIEGTTLSRAHRGGRLLSRGLIEEPSIVSRALFNVILYKAWWSLSLKVWRSIAEILHCDGRQHVHIAIICFCLAKSGGRTGLHLFQNFVGTCLMPSGRALVELCQLVGRWVALVVLSVDTFYHRRCAIVQVTH